MAIPEAVAEMVAALQPLAAEITGLQVTGYPTSIPSPPCIDIYWGAPFQQGAGFGVSSTRLNWIVRARVANSDRQAAADLLNRMLDTTDPASVEAALAGADVVVGNDGTVEAGLQFGDDNVGDMIGATWRVAMFL